MSYHGWRVLEAAALAAQKLNALIDNAPRGHFLNVPQMRDSVGGVGGNITEGLGRRRGPDRNYKFEVARGEARETIRRLTDNFEVGRVNAKDYWEIRNLLTSVISMLNSMLNK